MIVAENQKLNLKYNAIVLTTFQRIKKNGNGK